MFSRIPKLRLLPFSGGFPLAACAALFAGLSAAAPAADPIPSVPPRDWSKNPAIVELDLPGNVVVWAIGDTHGDYTRLIDLLVKGEIIDEVSRQPDQLANVRWKAGNAVLVCTGDMIDKGDQSIEVLQLFIRLQEIAPKSGGQVIVTMGNHEADSWQLRPKRTKSFSPNCSECRSIAPPSKLEPIG
jgi:Calcineurin-like phosphoesterase